MNITRTLLAASAVSVLTLGLGTGIALAQGPNSPECNAATFALVEAETRLANRVAQERVEELEALNAAKAAFQAAKTNVTTVTDAAKADNPGTPEDESAVTPAENTLIEQAQAARDVARDVRDARQRDFDTDSNRVADLRARVTVATQERDAACADPEPTPTPTPTPTTTPPPPPPAFVDLDCNDFPLPDGRSAQDVLNETPNDDPHNLDNNGNRIPCELPDADDDNAPVPSGGVDTGDGSSL